jgi:hypothetical protein
VRRGLPTAPEELAQLGRTMHRRRADILAYFNHHASNGPTEAINERLETLRRNALGFRNLTHYRLRSLTALRQPHPTDRRALIPEELLWASRTCSEKQEATGKWPVVSYLVSERQTIGKPLSSCRAVRERCSRETSQISRSGTPLEYSVG